jgi:hypothetical protein
MRTVERMFGLQTGVRCRGIGLSASRAYVKERFGAAGWKELLEALPDERSVAIWDALILPNGWYMASIYDEFLDAVDRCFGETAAVGEELGRRIGRAEVHYRIFLGGITDLTRVLDDSPRLWGAYFSEGAMCVMRREPQSIELVLHNPGLHRLICGQIVVGWGSEVLEAAGVEIVENVHHRCALDGHSSCGYRIRWR